MKKGKLFARLSVFVVVTLILFLSYQTIAKKPIDNGDEEYPAAGTAEGDNPYNVCQFLADYQWNKGADNVTDGPYTYSGAEVFKCCIDTDAPDSCPTSPEDTRCLFMNNNCGNAESIGSLKDNLCSKIVIDFACSEYGDHGCGFRKSDNSRNLTCQRSGGENLVGQRQKLGISGSPIEDYNETGTTHPGVDAGCLAIETVGGAKETYVNESSPSYCTETKYETTNVCQILTDYQWARGFVKVDNNNEKIIMCCLDVDGSIAACPTADRCMANNNNCGNAEGIESWKNNHCDNIVIDFACSKYGNHGCGYKKSDNARDQLCRRQMNERLVSQKQNITFTGQLEDYYEDGTDHPGSAVLCIGAKPMGGNITETYGCSNGPNYCTEAEFESKVVCVDTSSSMSSSSSTSSSSSSSSTSSSESTSSSSEETTTTTTEP